MWLRDSTSTVSGWMLRMPSSTRQRRICWLSCPAHVDDLEAELGQPRTLVAESDLNDPAHDHPAERGRVRSGRAVGRRHAPRIARDPHRRAPGYYVDFGSLAALAKVHTSAFLHDGCYSTFRGRLHGHPVDRVRTPAYRFIAYLQDHDQVGNRALGDRLPRSPRRVCWTSARYSLLTSPFTPMLWMGEE